MTADNLTFSIEIDFIPDIQDGRAELKKSMKSVSEKFDGTYILDPKARPIISGLSKASFICCPFFAFLAFGFCMYLA